jgi:hypothetical protein
MLMLCDAELKMSGAFMALAYLRACLVTSACSWIGNVENSSYLRPTSKGAALLLKPRACRCAHRVMERISKRAAHTHPFKVEKEKQKKKELSDAGSCPFHEHSYLRGGIPSPATRKSFGRKEETVHLHFHLLTHLPVPLLDIREGLDPGEIKHEQDRRRVVAHLANTA